MLSQLLLFLWKNGQKTIVLGSIRLNPAFLHPNLLSYTTSNLDFLYVFQRHPAVTPQSYPQVQAPIVNNPAFWERLGSDNIGTDTLFFAFYYQQVIHIPYTTIPGVFGHSYWKFCFVYTIFVVHCMSLYAEYLSTVFSCQRIEEAIMEVP